MTILDVTKVWQWQLWHADNITSAHFFVLRDLVASTPSIRVRVSGYRYSI